MSDFKVKDDKWKKLRAIFVERIEDSNTWKNVVRTLARDLPKQQLAEIMYEHFNVVYEDCFESEDSVENHLALMSEYREKLNNAWSEVGMSDFGILCILLPDSKDYIESEASLQEVFFFVCEDMEILCDELDSKMKAFVKLAEEILGFPVEYEFEGFLQDEHLGEVSIVKGGAKE